MSQHIRITADWRKEPDIDRLVQAFLGLAEELADAEDDPGPDAHRQQAGEQAESAAIRNDDPPSEIAS